MIIRTDEQRMNSAFTTKIELHVEDYIDPFVESKVSEWMRDKAEALPYASIENAILDEPNLAKIVKNWNDKE